jgi:tetratricopeptide (TPR) repeat protein
MNANYWTGRCFLRAIVGQLQPALEDCNESLRLRSDDIATLNSRAVTYLKLGQFDSAIADYDSSLRRDPKGAQALYGRGLAKQKKGDAAGGETDMTAAKAIAANIGADFAGWNVK